MILNCNVNFRACFLKTLRNFLCVFHMFIYWLWSIDTHKLIAFSVFKLGYSHYEFTTVPPLIDNCNFYISYKLFRNFLYISAKSASCYWLIFSSYWIFTLSIMDKYIYTNTHFVKYSFTENCTRTNALVLQLLSLLQERMTIVCMMNIKRFP